MKNKLASCSSKGTIFFDPCVLEMGREELNKVIVYELLHLRYKNHSKLFKLFLKTCLEEGL
ncbi:M48 metallopeptidase family protein [Pampinifervens diazotrophicum]|uniref:M48 metallopeptidase family protein n=1 Tax=Pampinifervens diazotrophicum TaxID=1632018 RepID=UPI002B261120|nr:M48 family metallopeptidase [Hydrogenobacter sp. T-2]